MREPRVTIIGLGLIGGSIGLALKDRRADIEITGYDIDPGVMESALAAGAIDRKARDLEAASIEADFVFIATPLPSIPKVLAVIARTVGLQTIISDVGSTKSTIVEAAEAALPPAVNFIGGHPMAGSEQGGFQSATRNLFEEAVYILTPTSSTSPEAFQRLHALLAKLGARVMALSPAKHDEIVAAVSHLPHVLAASLVNVVAGVEEGMENHFIFAAGGFRDTTRIAAGNPELWADICLDNKEAITEGIDKFQAALGEVRRFLGESNREALFELFASAKAERLSLTIGEPAPVFLREVDVVVSDRPGVISQITRTFGQVGLNIEDIQIVHLSGEKGVIKLVVNDDQNFDHALARLREYDFDVVVRK